MCAGREIMREYKQSAEPAAVQKRESGGEIRKLYLLLDMLIGS
jgi:hypothetical protein